MPKSITMSCFVLLSFDEALESIQIIEFRSPIIDIYLLICYNNGRNSQTIHIHSSGPALTWLNPGYDSPTTAKSMMPRGNYQVERLDLAAQLSNNSAAQCSLRRRFRMPIFDRGWNRIATNKTAAKTWPWHEAHRPAQSWRSSITARCRLS